MAVKNYSGLNPGRTPQRSITPVKNRDMSRSIPSGGFKSRVNPDDESDDYPQIKSRRKKKYGGNAIERRLRSRKAMSAAKKATTGSRFSL